MTIAVFSTWIIRGSCQYEHQPSRPLTLVLISSSRNDVGESLVNGMTNIPGSYLFIVTSSSEDLFGQL